MTLEDDTQPKYIVVTRSFTYDVEDIKSSIRELNNDPELEVRDEEVWDLVHEWAYEDMSSKPTRHDMSFTDEDGNPL
jgi:hypothetical protein